MNRIAFITGATSGIGKACAEKFASEKFDLILTGRRSDRLEILKKDIENTYTTKVLTLCFDVQNRADVFLSIANIPEGWKKIDVLINNAGLALGRDNFKDANIDDWDTMMQTNVNGLLYVSKAILPYFIAQKKGHIINIGSIAGKEVYESGNAYCGSKFAVDAISKSMRIDLLKDNIKVTAIHPGAVETEFSVVRFKGDYEKANAAYIGYQPLVAKDIADTIFYAANLPAHVCINDLVITCTQQASSSHFNKEAI
jgi:NADP-dependent 3-hydroxy acid dehydrogenase YdfG